MIPAVAGCLHPSYLTTRRSRVNIMIRASRLALELPQILELMKVGHCLGVPLLSFLGWNLRGAHVYGHIAAQPEICVAGHMDCAYRKVGVRRCELGISGFERCAAAKLAKIGFRRIKNELETRASPVLLVLTLCERRNSEKTRTKKRKKPRNFSVHGVPALEMRHACTVSKDRAGSAPAAASAYFSDSSYVRTILQLVKKQMGLTPRGLPILYSRNRTPARPRSPSSFDLSNALSNNPAWRKLLRGSPCLLSIANSQVSVASPQIRPRNSSGDELAPGARSRRKRRKGLARGSASI